MREKKEDMNEGGRREEKGEEEREKKKGEGGEGICSRSMKERKEERKDK